MQDKLDYKKAYKDLYMPKQKPMLVDVPAMNFIMVDGTGAPGGIEYQNAMQTLYALSFTIKMSKMQNQQPEGYFEYVIPPLEGLWWTTEGVFDFQVPRDKWCWTSMIRQPEFVTPEVFDWAVQACMDKKPEVDVSKARFVSFTEGLCVQMLHVGPYDQESGTLSSMEQYITENSLIKIMDNVHKHHEIYLSDPRRTAPERLKTVLRIPVAK